MRNALEAYPLMSAPTLEQIELEIGPFSSSMKSVAERTNQKEDAVELNL